MNAILAERVRALPENQKFPLAHEWPAVPRLPPAARRTRAGQLFAMTDPIAERIRKDWRTNDQVDRPYRAVFSVSSITTPSMSIHRDMIAELAEDNKTRGRATAR